jgi:hypothetical protein
MSEAAERERVHTGEQDQRAEDEPVLMTGLCIRGPAQVAVGARNRMRLCASSCPHSEVRRGRELLHEHV